MKVMKTIYRVLKDTVEIKSNSRLGDGSMVGRPFPRTLTADEIEEIYFAGDTDEITIGDFDNREDAEKAANEIEIETVLYDWAVPFVKADIVRIEEIEIDDDEDETFTGNCWMFRCKEYEE